MADEKKALHLKQRLVALEAMDREALLIEWRRHFKPPPRNTRRDYLLAEIGYHLQVQAHGRISPTIRNKLERMAFGEQQQAQPKYNIANGTRLVREWNGVQHSVIVHTDGYEYDGKRYRSLTNIACKITGTRWSGPLFFGLKKQERQNAKAA